MALPPGPTLPSIVPHHEHQVPQQHHPHYDLQQQHAQAQQQQDPQRRPPAKMGSLAPVQRKQRAVLTCEECRRKKIRCSRTRGGICERCKTQNIPCRPSNPETNSPPRIVMPTNLDYSTTRLYHVVQDLQRRLGMSDLELSHLVRHYCTPEGMSMPAAGYHLPHPSTLEQQHHQHQLMQAHAHAHALAQHQAAQQAAAAHAAAQAAAHHHQHHPGAHGGHGQAYGPSTTPPGSSHGESHAASSADGHYDPMTPPHDGGAEAVGAGANGVHHDGGAADGVHSARGSTAGSVAGPGGGPGSSAGAESYATPPTSASLGGHSPSLGPGAPHGKAPAVPMPYPQQRAPHGIAGADIAEGPTAPWATGATSQWHADAHGEQQQQGGGQPAYLVDFGRDAWAA